MATGINVEKLNNIKIGLLNDIEKLNEVIEKYEEVIASVPNTLSGEIKKELLNKMINIKEQLPNVKENINNYIYVLDKVENIYEVQDKEIGKKITNDVQKIEDMKEE